MATAFLFNYKEAFIAYAFTPEEMELNGAKRSHQRFEQCLQLLEKNASPALKALEAQHLFDAAAQKGVEDLAVEAMLDFSEQITMKIDDANIRAKILNKVNSIKLIVMFPDDVLNTSKIDDIYDDLKLDGTEAFVKMYVDLVLHAGSIERESDQSWIKALSNILKKELKMYDADLDIFCKTT